MTKVFSMFSGIGGFELGLLMSEKNVKLVGYSEIDKYAIEVFEKQFKGINNYGNATTIDETKLPNFDLFVGGFPCQAFSTAGKKAGFDDARGTLFFDIARILKEKRPKGFLLENVEGLVVHDKKNKSDAIVLLISSLEEWAVEGGFELILSIGRSKSLIDKHKKLGYTVDDNPSYEIIKKI